MKRFDCSLKNCLWYSLLLLCWDYCDGTDYWYYDNLRSSGRVRYTPLVTNNAEFHVGRNMHLVEVDENRDNDIVLCHIPTIFRFSSFHTDVSSRAYGGSAAALMAMQDFNNGDGCIVPELQGINRRCNIRLTGEILDSASSTNVGVQELKKLITRRPSSLDIPQPCAILGASWSSVTMQLVPFAGAHGVFQVTPSASSTELDDETTFPLFGRTHPSDAAMAKLSMRYLSEELGLKHIGVFYVSTSFGNEFNNELLRSSFACNVTLVSQAFGIDASEEEIRTALLSLDKSTFNAFIGVFFNSQFESVMRIAHELGMAGPDSGKWWFFTGSLAGNLVDTFKAMNKNSAQANATYGSAIIHDESGVPGAPQYEKFLHRWKQLGTDISSLAYINSKMPTVPSSHMGFNRNASYFDGKPSHIAAFSYDAIVGLGLSACKAIELHGVNFTAEQHHFQFKNQTFSGASGNVIMDKNTNSRTANSTYQVISNILPIDAEGLEKDEIAYKGYPRTFFDPISQTWKKWKNSTEFIYPDGTNTIPADIQPVNEDKHYIQPFIRHICLSIAGLAFGLSVFFIGYTLRHRKVTIIAASQPTFLMMLCVGTGLMSLMIIPSSMDDSVLGQKGCNLACASRTWFFSLGFLTCFSALFSKLWRINKMAARLRSFRRAKVTAKDVILPFLTLLFLNFAILITWSVKSPVVFERTSLAYDSYNRVMESKGGCTSSVWVPYMLALFLVNGTALVLALLQAFKARKVKTQYSESRYIAMSMTWIFQTLLLGLPVMLWVKSEPNAFLVIQSAIVSIISISILVLVFVPKMFFMMKKDGTKCQESYPETTSRGEQGREGSTLSDLSSSNYTSSWHQSDRNPIRSSSNSSITFFSTSINSFIYSMMRVVDPGQVEQASIFSTGQYSSTSSASGFDTEDSERYEHHSLSTANRSNRNTMVPVLCNTLENHHEDQDALEAFNDEYSSSPCHGTIFDSLMEAVKGFWEVKS